MAPGLGPQCLPDSSELTLGGVAWQLNSLNFPAVPGQEHQEPIRARAEPFNFDWHALGVTPAFEHMTRACLFWGIAVSVD